MNYNKDFIDRMKKEIKSVNQSLINIYYQLDNFNKNLEENIDDELTSCMSNYSPCPNNPRTCVHDDIPKKKKEEICLKSDIPKGEILYEPSNTFVEKRSGRFYTADKKKNFPVAHRKGLSKSIPDSDLFNP